MIKTCLVCKKEYKARPNDVRHRRTKYCSISCQRNRKTGIEKKCIICKKKIYVYKSRVKRGQGKYCSRQCFGKGKALEVKGEKNYFYGKKHTDKTKKTISISKQCINEQEWRGFITPQNKVERIKFGDTVQKEVLKRDNYICQNCEKRGGYLHVDHIKPWSKYIGDRFKMDNLRTLCRECHYLISFGKEIPQGSKWGINQYQPQ